VRHRHRDRRFALPLLIALATSLLIVSDSGATEPYSLRGFRLGIALAEFKAMQVPDHDIWPGARPLCFSDREAKTPGTLSADDGIRLSEAEKQAGIGRCGFFHPAGGVLAPAGLVIANARAAVSFVFVPDREGTLRLAAIEATTASSNYDSIKAALVKKYGRPKSVMKGYALDATGSRLVDETAKWSNEVSDIKLDRREEDKDIQRMLIEYTHEELAADGLKRLKAIQGNSANTL